MIKEVEAGYFDCCGPQDCGMEAVVKRPRGNIFIETKRRVCVGKYCMAWVFDTTYSELDAENKPIFDMGGCGLKR
jgi:hypothetical protein